MKNIKKPLAVFLTLVMVLAMVPMTAFATDEPELPPSQISNAGSVLYFDENGNEASADNFVVSTSKTIESTEVENEFEITLEVQTTVNVETISVDPSAAVVLVMDVSGSMEGDRLTAAKKAAVDFIDSYVKDANGAARQLSIVTFYGIDTGTIWNHNYKGYSEVVLDWTDLTVDGTDEAKQIINGLKAQLGTFTQGGLMLARNLYLPAYAPKVVVDGDEEVIDNRFVVLLTDGNPTHMLGSTNSNPTLSSTSITNLTGNRLEGTESDVNVPPARGAATAVAKQIKEGNFNGNYPAQIFTIGFGISGDKYANTSGGSGRYTGDEWLQSSIASDQAHYNVADASNLNLAFESIAETITRIANAWKVTDPMAEYIVYGSDLVINDETNKGSFDMNTNTLSWSIKASEPVETNVIKRGNVDTTIYTYKLSYKVNLDNLSGYAVDNVIDTNERTYLDYIMSVKAIDLSEDNNYIEADFTIPRIRSFDADLTFTKVDGDEAPLAGAEFTLFYGDETYDTATSDEVGVVTFTGIPSGHEYTLAETKAPDGYTSDDQTNAVAVSYGDLTLNGGSSEGFTVVNEKIDTRLIIEKVWLDGDGEETTYDDYFATFTVTDSDGETLNITELGSYEVASGSYVITEDEFTDFDLVSITGGTSDIESRTAIVEIQNNETVTVTFTNQYAPAEFIGTISLEKVVIDGDAKVMIAMWLSENADNFDYDPTEILEDITFEIYNSNANGEDLGKVNGVTGTINMDSLITFASDSGPYGGFAPGWYLVREVLGAKAADIFQDPISDLLIYFNGTSSSAKTGQGGATVDPDAAFTITQFKDESRPLQAIYKDAAGNLKYLRTAPALDVPNPPNKGGSALTTSRFTATSEDGTEYMSFCADIGAIGVKGTYYVDEDNHGLSAEEVQKLVAAIDYIYAQYGFENYEGIALAQIVVWNMVLEFSDDPMIADLWLRSIEEGLRYTTAWGELIKIEGYNNSNGTNYWYTPQYKAVVEDILANMNGDKYVEIYQARVLNATGTYVSGAVFLKGDESYANYYQQRQVLILFDDPAVVENIPIEEAEFTGTINLDKVVADDGQKISIKTWLSENDYSEEEILDILADITFNIHALDEYGNEGAALDAIGVIDGSRVEFYRASTYETNPTPYAFETGWYLVKEQMGPMASAIFKGDAELVFFFNAEVGTIIGNTIEVTPLPADTRFTVTQYKDQSRPLQAIYRDEAGNLKYLRTAPALNVENRPNNGGGALATSRFTATSEAGNEYMSFCADIGAIGVKGKYVIDADKFGFTDEQVEQLVAALDFIYKRSAFTEYEDIALAQLVVWNLVLQYSDDPMIADLWLRNIADGLLYKDAWGELIKIEGYNNTNGTNYWYTPEYKALVDDIIANPDQYVAAYKKAVANGEDRLFVGGVEFLKGDGSYVDYYQQRQILIQFGDPPTIANLPKDEVEPDSYTVTFVDWDGTVIGDPQIVKEGEAATAPDDPIRDGYTFTGWDTDFTNVTQNLTVTAQYEEDVVEVEYEVSIYDDYTGEVLYGGKIADGYSFTVTLAEEVYYGIDIDGEETGMLLTLDDYGVERISDEGRGFEFSLVWDGSTVTLTFIVI